MSIAKWIRPKNYQSSGLSAQQVAQLCSTAKIRQPSMEMLANDLVRLAYTMRAKAIIKRRLEARFVVLDELQNPTAVAAIKRYAGLNHPNSEAVAVDLKKRAAGDVDA